MSHQAIIYSSQAVTHSTKTINLAIQNMTTYTVV